MNIERWISGYKATAADWYDGKNIYFEVEYYSPGQSVSAPPVWSKSYLLPIENAQTVQEYFDSVTNALAMNTDERKMLAMYKNGTKIIGNGKKIA